MGINHKKHLDKSKNICYNTQANEHTHRYMLAIGQAFLQTTLMVVYRFFAE